MVSSHTESVWDDHERMLLDALTDWENDQHICGRPASESLRLIGREDTRYVVGEKICVGCKAIDDWAAARHEAWKQAQEKGHRPWTYTLPTVYLESEALEIAKQQKG